MFPFKQGVSDGEAPYSATATPADKAVYDIYWMYAKVCQGVSIVMAPWPSMHDPIKSLLNAHGYEADRLTLKWKEAKLQELNYVGITSALITGAVIGSFQIYSADTDPWSTNAFWVSALLLSLTSISIATQQSIGLNRLSSHENGLGKIRLLLGEENPRFDMLHMATYTGRDQKITEYKFRMRKGQLWIWQTPVMLLNFAILLFIIGLMIAVFSRAVKAHGDLSTGDTKTAIFFGFAAIFAGGNYIVSWICLNRRSR